MKTSKKGIDLIKNFEALRLKAYKCPAGVWTIGYGHTGNVRPDDVIIQGEAEELLKRDLARFEAAVTAAAKVSLAQEQFDALVSFTYNCGIGAFQGSALLRLLNSGDYTGAAEEFKRWNKSGTTILEGLIRRREAEKILFLSCAPTPAKKFEIESLSNGKANLYINGVLKFLGNKKETVIDYLTKNL